MNDSPINTGMSTQELISKEIKGLPEELQLEGLRFCQFSPREV